MWFILFQNILTITACNVSRYSIVMLLLLPKNLPIGKKHSKVIQKCIRTLVGCNSALMIHIVFSYKADASITSLYAERKLFGRKLYQ